jgi:hypothetical protein
MLDNIFLRNSIYCFFSILIFALQIKIFEPSFGGDSSRFFLYYFALSKNNSNYLINSLNELNQFLEFSNFNFYTDINYYLSLFIDKKYLYFLNNFLLVFLCLVSLRKIYFIFNKFILEFKKINEIYYIIFSFFYLCNPWIFECIINSGEWKYIFFLFPVFLSLFLNYLFTKEKSSILYFLIVSNYYSIFFFSPTNFGFLIPLFVFFLFFTLFLIKEKIVCFSQIKKTLFIFFILLILTNLHVIYAIYQSYKSSLIFDNSFFPISSYERSVPYIKSYIHHVNPFYLLIRLPEIHLNIFTNSQYKDIYLSVFNKTFFPNLIILFYFFYIYFNYFFKTNKDSKSKVFNFFLKILIITFIFLSVNFHQYFIDIFYNIFYINFSSVLRSFNQKLLPLYNFVFTLISFFVFLKLFTIKKKILKNIYIVIIMIINCIYIVELNSSNYVLSKIHKTDYHRIGVINENFSNDIEHLCTKYNNYNSLTLPLSYDYDFIINKKTKSVYSGGRSFAGFICKNKNFYKINSLEEMSSFTNLVNNLNYAQLHDFFNKNSIGIIILRKIPDEIYLNYFPNNNQFKILNNFLEIKKIIRKLDFKEVFSNDEYAIYVNNNIKKITSSNSNKLNFKKINNTEFQFINSEFNKSVEINLNLHFSKNWEIIDSNNKIKKISKIMKNEEYIKLIVNDLDAGKYILKYKTQESYEKLYWSTRIIFYTVITIILAFLYIKRKNDKKKSHNFNNTFFNY